mgnify:CR=1 FL=1
MLKVDKCAVSGVVTKRRQTSLPLQTRCGSLIKSTYFQRQLEENGAYPKGWCASNAMMILCCLPGGTALSGENFDRVLMWRANLNYSILAGCSFKGADLEGSSLVKVMASGANFEGANFKNAHFGKFPSFREHSLSIANHPSQPLLASASGAAISIRNLEGKTLAVLQGHKERITSVAWCADGHLASGSHDETVRVWDTHTGVF